MSLRDLAARDQAEAQMHMFRRGSDVERARIAAWLLARATETEAFAGRVIERLVARIESGEHRREEEP
jgi:hypothetical protein